MLWVGCGNVSDDETAPPGDGAPAKEEMTWHRSRSWIWISAASSDLNRRSRWWILRSRPRPWNSRTQRLENPLFQTLGGATKSPRDIAASRRRGSNVTTVAASASSAVARWSASSARRGIASDSINRSARRWIGGVNSACSEDACSFEASRDKRFAPSGVRRCSRVRRPRAEAISVTARSDTITSVRPASAWFKASLSATNESRRLCCGLHERTECKRRSAAPR
jgi:hypothetical protein